MAALSATESTEVKHLTALVEGMGIEWPDLAAKADMGYSHLRNIATNQKPITIKAGNKIAMALGLTLVQVLGHASLRPIPSGSISGHGDLMSDTAATTGYFVLSEPFPGLAPAGYLVHVIDRSEWMPGRHLAIRYADGRVRIREAQEDGGQRWLVDELGDQVRFDPDRHAVIGRVSRVLRDFEE